jgi:hypothetical protein
MEQNLELLEFMNTLINTTEYNTMILNKKTLQSVITCFQVMEYKVRVLQGQCHLLNDKLINLKNQQPMKFSELVLFGTTLSMMIMMINNQ